MFNKIFTFILVILIVGTIVYIGYHCFCKSKAETFVPTPAKTPNTESVSPNDDDISVTPGSLPPIRLSLSDASDILSNSLIKQKISLESDGDFCVDNFLPPSVLSELSDGTLSTASDNSRSASLNSINSVTSQSDHIVKPSNVEMDTKTWDDSFGMPLMRKKDSQRYFSQLQKENERYGRSLGKFNKYQTDRSTIIQTDVTIDPFKPSENSSKLSGKTIREIYDKQVEGPKAVPKKIKKQTVRGTIYEDEEENNGGIIRGTKNLVGYGDLDRNVQKSASFGNAF